MSNKIKLEFSESEALVLFDWIARFNKEEDNEFEDKSEEILLWDIEALLEKKLIDHLKGDYCKLLKKSRVTVRSNR